MRTFRNSFIVKGSIERVWDFYTHVKHLETITPDKIDLKIIKATNERIVLGQEILISGKIITKIRSNWHSKITLARPYEYVDEMLTGPFRKWKHSHKFYNINGKQTEIEDIVEFELPYG
ncbi:MAG: SRPBCC family protein, partial [Candidatus Nitrosocosmicus sp.]